MDQQDNRRHNRAIASMVLGILSLVFLWMPYIGFILALLAVAFSASSINGASAQTSDSTRGMAVAGLVTGILGMVVGLPYACGLACLCTMFPAFGFYW